MPRVFSLLMFSHRSLHLGDLSFIYIRTHSILVQHFQHPPPLLDLLKILTFALSIFTFLQQRGSSLLFIPPPLTLTKPAGMELTAKRGDTSRSKSKTVRVKRSRNSSGGVIKM